MRKWDFMPSTESVLADMRANGDSVRGSGQDVYGFQRALKQTANPLLDRMGLRYVEYHVGLSFVKSLARPLRTGSWSTVAEGLEQFWQGWVQKGMDRDLAEAITCGLYCLLTRRPQPILRSTSHVGS
jgi:hypothetical protein